MNQISSFSNINYPTPPSYYFCDAAFGLGLALESGGVAASMVGLANLGLPSMITGRIVRIAESMLCKSADPIESIWNSPWDFASDLYQIASIHVHRKYTRHLKADIRKFNKAKPIHVSSLKNAYEAAASLAQSIKTPTASLATGSTAKILKRNTASLAKHTANAAKKAIEAADAKALWEAAKSSVSPSKTILQLFKPLHIALTTIPPVVMKFFQQNSVKEEQVRIITNAMLTIAKPYGIVYDKSLDLLDESVQIDIDLKDIAAQAHQKLGERIDDLRTYTVVLFGLLRQKPPATNKEIIEAVSALHKQVENELGFKKSAVDSFAEIKQANNKGEFPTFIADGTRPLFDLQQIAVYALQDLDPDVMEGLSNGIELASKGQELMNHLHFLVEQSQSLVETLSKTSGKKAIEAKKNEVGQYIAYSYNDLDRLANEFTPDRRVKLKIEG